ncbi:MAG: FHA domain-containing protein [Planctomycetota bacterium]
MVTLRIRTGKTVREEEFEGSVVLVGRGPTTDLSLQDPEISKEHCLIERLGDRWKLVDLESKNGTRVNGKYRNKAWLRTGDLIQLGGSVVELGGGGPAGPRLGEQEGTARQRVRARRRGTRRNPGDIALVVGLVILGLTVGAFVIRAITGGTEDPDRHNKELVEHALALEKAGRARDAVDHLRLNADTDVPSYHDLVVPTLEKIAGRSKVKRQRDAENEARTLFVRLQKRIAWYHRGEKYGVTDIMPWVERLKTEYADTESGRQARRLLPEWFAGRPPPSNRDLGITGTSSSLGREWVAARRRAQEYIKEWQFREARETLERFFAAREALLDAAKREEYERKVEEEVGAILRRAGATFVMQRQKADQLVRNSNYTRAIAIYHKVMERFGIDEYVRRAQLEIQKIEERQKSAE